MLINEFLNKDPYIVPEEYPIISLDSKSAMFLSNNGKDTKHTSHISRREHFVRNGKNCKMHNIYFCEGGPQFSDIATNNVVKNYLNPKLKHIMVRTNN